MLAANGSTSGNSIVWSQSVSLVIGEPYQFTMYVSNWSVGSSPEQLARLRFSVDGTPVGSDFTANANAAIWDLMDVSFIAINATATISVIDTTITAGGNDFALDDLSLAKIPEPSTAVLMALAILPGCSGNGIQIGGHSFSGPEAEAFTIARDYLLDSRTLREATGGKPELFDPQLSFGVGQKASLLCKVDIAGVATPVKVDMTYDDGWKIRRAVLSRSDNPVVLPLP